MNNCPKSFSNPPLQCNACINARIRNVNARRLRKKKESFGTVELNQQTLISTSMEAKRAFSLDISSGSPCNSGTKNAETKVSIRIKG